MTDLSNAKTLSTYELAESLESIAESNAELAKRLGRSRTYVSKMRTTMRHACPSLRSAWKANELSYDMVKRLAIIKSATEQSKALAAYLRATKSKTRAAKGVARATIEALCKTCGGPNEDTERAQCIECDNDLEHVNDKINRETLSDTNAKERH